MAGKSSSVQPSHNWHLLTVYQKGHTTSVTQLHTGAARKLYSHFNRKVSHQGSRSLPGLAAILARVANR